MYTVASFFAVVMGKSVASAEVLDVCRPTQLADAC
jgi:hypothetical protein